MVARWMVEHGARYLLLLSRSGPAGHDVRGFLKELEGKGVTVRTPACDISDMEALEICLKKCEEELPSIRGCVQASMVLNVRFSLLLISNPLLFPLIFRTHTSYAGLPLFQSFLLLLDQQHPPESPRLLQPPLLTAFHRFLHPPLLPLRHLRTSRPGQLRRRKHLPR
jgi:hypothetical protein